MKQPSANSSFGLVIPYYNQPESLSACLDSVLKQSRIPDQLIIVDDASQVGVKDTIARFKALLPLELCRLPQNVGPSAARNYGARKLDTDYILFLDSDDCWKPNHVEVLAEVVESSGVSFAATAYDYRFGEKLCRSISPNSDSSIVTDIFSLLPSLRLPFITSSSCVSKDLFSQIGGFHEGLRLGEDQLLWVRVWLNSDIYLINSSTVVYNMNTPGSATKVSNSREILDYLSEIKNAVVKEGSGSKLRARSYHRYISRQYFRACVAAACESETRFKVIYSQKAQYSNELSVLHNVALFFINPLGYTVRKKVCSKLLSLASWLRFFK